MLNELEMVGFVATWAAALSQRLLQATATLLPATKELIGPAVAGFPRENRGPITVAAGVRGVDAICWALHYTAATACAFYLFTTRLGLSIGSGLVCASALTLFVILGFLCSRR